MLIVVVLEGRLHMNTSCIYKLLRCLNDLEVKRREIEGATIIALQHKHEIKSNK